MTQRTISVKVAQKHCVAIGNSYSSCMNCNANYLGGNICNECGTELVFGASAGSCSDEQLDDFCQEESLLHLNEWYVGGSDLVRHDVDAITIDMSRRRRS